MTSKTIGARLREARIKAGLTQQQLADKAGVPVTTLSRYENGRIEPEVGTCARLCRTLHVSADWLLGLAEEEAREFDGWEEEVAP